MYRTSRRSSVLVRTLVRVYIKVHAIPYNRRFYGCTRFVGCIAKMHSKCSGPRAFTQPPTPTQTHTYTHNTGNVSIIGYKLLDKEFFRDDNFLPFECWRHLSKALDYDNNSYVSHLYGVRIRLAHEPTTRLSNTISG